MLWCPLAEGSLSLRMALVSLCWLISHAVLQAEAAWSKSTSASLMTEARLLGWECKVVVEHLPSLPDVLGWLSSTTNQDKLAVVCAAA